MNIDDDAAIAARSMRARDEMIARHAAAILQPFPAVDPMREFRAVKDRIVVLPETRWVDGIAIKLLAAGSDYLGGWYFARRAVRADRPADREPALAYLGGVVTPGHSIEVLGALIGGRVFVDATRVIDGESPYVGEDDPIETRAR